MNKKYQLEGVEKNTVAEVIAFLQKHEDYSLFLLGNLKNYGYCLNQAVNSGNYKVIRSDSKIRAVFSLTRRQSLLIQSETLDEDLLEYVLAACHSEQIPILGFLTA